MMKTIQRLLLTVILLTTAHSLTAQETTYGLDTLISRKTVTSTKLFGIGYTDMLDTYLSPGSYTGAELRFLSHIVRDYDDKPVSKLLLHQAFLTSVENKARNASELGGIYSFSYGLLYNWNFLDGNFNVKAGATADADLGVLYNMRNSNNPVQVRAGVHLSPTVAVTYNAHMGNFPINLRYEVAAPLVGFMFSPNYGQSYYEIFSRHDYDHNLVFTHPFNTPSLRQMLTLDITVMRQTFRMGYLNDVRQAKVNNLRQHQYTHALVVGWVKHFKLVKLTPH